MNVFLQYLIFDKTGDKILDANAVPCDSIEDARAVCDNFVDYYKNSGEMNDTQLTLFAFVEGKKVCWFSSNEQ